MPHLVLLGDSIFDNAVYVPGEPAVIEQVRAALGAQWRATLLAVDGAVVTDVHDQLGELPADATHLAISAGGNDALRHSGVLFQSVKNSAQVFAAIAGIQDDFRRQYRAMLAAAMKHRLPTLVCTIYDAVPGLGREGIAGLSLFNDVIVHEAARHNVPILDLRLICNEARHYSSLSPIEPSAAGGQRIADALARAMRAPGCGNTCVIFA
jgi:hypothetical protein